MKQTVIKFFINFGPIITFFGVYYYEEKKLIPAITCLLVATLLSIIANFIYENKIALLPLLGAIIISSFGGLTIYFENPIFFYMRPTLVHVAIGMFLLFGGNFLKEIPAKIILKKIIKMKKKGYEILNKRFIALVFFLALLNEVIWRTQSEEVWVNYKVWGGSLISFIFCIAQIRLIQKYMRKN